MTVRYREALAIWRQLEQVGRIARFAKPVADRRKDRIAIQVLQGLQPGIREGAEQRPRGPRLVHLSGGHLRHELGKPSFRQSLGPEKPDPADFLRREPPVAGV